MLTAGSDSMQHMSFSRHSARILKLYLFTLPFPFNPSATRLHQQRHLRSVCPLGQVLTEAPFTFKSLLASSHAATRRAAGTHAAATKNSCTAKGAGGIA